MDIVYKGSTVALFIRRSNGIEVQVQGQPAEAAAEFEKWCAYFDDAPGYAGKTAEPAEPPVTSGKYAAWRQRRGR